MSAEDTIFPLAAGFDAPETASWRALAEKALRGVPFERLTGRTADGIAIAPLYREADIATAADPAGMPGAAPFIRGASARRDPLAPWRMRQAFAHPDPETTNREILADLAGGVSAIELVIDPTGRTGCAIAASADLDRALADVHADLAPVGLDAGAYGLWAADLLRTRLKGLSAQGAAFNVDPLGALMRSGECARGDIAAAARFAHIIADDMPGATSLRVDARPVHEAGGTEAHELAVALAAGVAYLRALDAEGVGADAASDALLFTLAIGPDVLVEAAKLRALRLCWARIIEASGGAKENTGRGGARLHAVTSRRMLTRRDPWTNILRGTAACFAACVGGADAITTAPLTDALGLPTPFARRIARNTQLVLMEESHLGHVIDPAGGAWFVEALTRDLAAAAWAKFQAIETEGGLIEALAKGSLQRDVAAARATRQKAIATRRESITGVTDFPLLDERMPDYVSYGWTQAATIAATASKADLTAEAFAPIRWAEPFEALRDAAARAKPAIFFANLGPLAEFSPRANFARNLFAAGGVAAIDSEALHEHDAARCAAWAASASPVAVLCGSDERYTAEGEAAARALKAAGCAHIVYAGKPTDEAPWRAAGVTHFVFAGQDAIAALSALHRALGVAA